MKLLDRATLWHGHPDGTVTVEQRADVQPIREIVHALDVAGADATPSGDKHVAEVPVIVLQEWARERGKTYADMMQNDGLMREFLTDPANSAFRVWKGRL